MLRQVHGLHGADDDVVHGFVDGDVVVDPRYGTFDFDGGQTYRSSRCGNRYRPSDRHRKIVVVGTVIDRVRVEIGRSEVVQIRMGVGNDVKRVYTGMHAKRSVGAVE